MVDDTGAESLDRLTNLKSRISGLLSKYKGDHSYQKKVLADLQRGDLRPLDAEEWSQDLLVKFLKEHLPEERKAAAPKRKPRRKSSKKGTKAKETTPEPGLTPSDELGSAPRVSLADHYPTFRSDLKRKQVQLRLSEELVKRVEERRRSNVPKYGKSTAKLVEMLLWHFIDSPEEFEWKHEGEPWKKSGKKGQ